MNRIFKTVWSRTKNMYVVVSEIANSCGKSKGRHVIDIKAAFAAVLILTSSVPFGIHAALTPDQQAVYDAVMQQLAQENGKKDIHFFSSNGSDSGINYDNQGARAGYTTAVGPDAMATEENSQAFGYRARAIGHSSIVFGVESTASGARDIAIGYGSHAVGSDNTNTSWNDTIAIGWNALSRGGAFASGSGAVAGGSRFGRFGSFASAGFRSRCEMECSRLVRHVRALSGVCVGSVLSSE